MSCCQSKSKVALIAALVLMGSAAAHHNAFLPRGFSTERLLSVDEVHRHCSDDDKIYMRGRLTRYFGDEDYEFTDLFGNTIEVELDDDEDWSHISKDQLIDIFGKVDRDLFKIKIEVKGARPVAEDESQSAGLE